MHSHIHLLIVFFLFFVVGNDFQLWKKKAEMKLLDGMMVIQSVTFCLKTADLGPAFRTEEVL